MSLSQSPERHAQPDDDKELESAMAQAMRVLDEAGMTVQDLLDELPAAGEEVMRRIYGDALVDDLLRDQHVAAEC